MPPHYCNANNKTSPALIKKELTKQRVLELRISAASDGGVWSYDRLAEEFGVSVYTVWRWVSEALAEIKYDNRERAHELRAVNHNRLELAISKIIDRIQGDVATSQDFNTLIRLIQTQNKMWGVNEPDAMELTVKVESMTTEEKIARISELMSQAHRVRLKSGEEWHVYDEPKGRVEKPFDTQVVDVSA